MRSALTIVALLLMMITAPSAWAATRVAGPDDANTASGAGWSTDSGFGAQSAAGGVRSYEPVGIPVTGSTGLLQGPTLQPGQYLDSISPGQVKYYSIQVESGTAYVATTMARPLRVHASSSDALETVTLDADGKTCQSSSRVTPPYNGIAPLTAVSGAGPVTAAGNGDRCSKPGRYYLSVTRTDDPKSDPSPVPLELLYILEPALSGPTPSPLPEVPLGPSNNSTTPVQVRGTGTFTDATTLRSGTYRDGIRPGETVFYRVPVGWGQRLQYDVAFDPSGYDKSISVETTVYNPYRGEIAEKGTSLYRSPEVLHQSTATVDYTHRDASDRAIGRTRLAGYYYIAVRLANITDLQIGETEVPVNLVVNVLGTALSAPQYLGAGSVGDPLPPASTQDVQNTAERGSTGSVPVLGIGLGVAALIAGASAVVLARRYAVRAAQGVQPPR